MYGSFQVSTLTNFPYRGFVFLAMFIGRNCRFSDWTLSNRVTAFSKLRFKHLSRHTFGEPRKVAGINSRLKILFVSSKRFVDQLWSSDSYRRVYGITKK